MKEKIEKKGGRPLKVSVNEKKKIIMDFYMNTADGDATIFVKRDIYTKLAEFAKQNKNIDLKSYDFSRCTEAKELIKSLIDKLDNPPTMACAFVPADIEWFLRDDISLAKRRKVLIEREDYFNKMYVKSVKALETYKAQEDTIEALKSNVRELNQQLSSVKEDIQLNNELRKENNELRKENTFLKKMIRVRISDEAAVAIITGSPTNIKNSLAFITPDDIGAATVSIKQFQGNNSVPNISDIKTIFKLNK